MLTVYKASAGSGKTFQLARKYIQLILGYQSAGSQRWRLYPPAESAHGDVLAITFTNKATAEMKKRIIEELSVLASDSRRSESAHLDYYIDLFSADADTVGQRAKAALKALLVNFRDFNVSTIDSFFQTVLRNFAHELDLPDNFELLLDDREIIEIAVEDLLNTVNGTSELLEKKPRSREIKDISNWLVKYMDSRLSEGKYFNLFNRDGKFRDDLVNFIGHLMDENFKVHFNEIMDWCGDREKIEKFENKIVERVSYLNKKIAGLIDNLPQLPSEFVAKRGGIETLVDKLRKGDDPTKLASWDKIANKDFGWILKKDFYKPANYDEDLQKSLERFCTETYECYNQRVFYRLLLRHLYPLGLIGEVIKRMEAYRKEKGAFLLSDTNNFLHKIINGDDTPFIYERLGNKLRHFLLDEFQDTSLLQWENLKPLIRESLATDNDNLIIGDEKQCIYRFRNSDPELINSGVRRDIPSSVEKGRLLTENTNWRSAVNIVKFNNSLFLSLAMMLGVEDYYLNTVQQVVEKKDKPAGYIDMVFARVFDKEAAGNDSSDDVDNGSYKFEYGFIEDDEDTDYPVKVALDRLCSNVVRQLKQGYRPCDIAVLVRSRDEGDTVIRCLIELFKHLEWENSPEVVSSDALKLSDSPIVNYIISRLRMTLLPSRQDVAEGGAAVMGRRFEKQRRIRNLFNNFHLLNAIDKDSTSKSESLEKAVEKSAPWHKDEEDADTKITQGISIIQMVEGVLEDYKGLFDETEGEAATRRENVYISSFLDRIMEFESWAGSDLWAFLQWWDEKGADSPVSLAENVNAIIVSTIHKSKGLEYKCVHVPFVSLDIYSTTTHRGLCWFRFETENETIKDVCPPYIPLTLNKLLGDIPEFKAEYEAILRNDRLDALNILYVALTRAVDELIVTVTGTIGGNRDTTRSKMSQLLYDAMSDTEAANVFLETDTERELKKRLLINLPDYFDGCSLRIGEPLTKVAGNRKEKAEGINCSMPDYEPGRRLMIEELTKPLNLGRINWEDNAERGEFFHEVLSRTMRQDDLEFALKQVAYKRKLTEGMLHEARELLDKAFNSPVVKRWFNDFSSVLNETPIYDIDFSQQKRPDRIMIFPDGSIEIVDFKFAVPDKKHVEQVRHYMALMSRISTGPVTGYLWYPLRGHVEKVNL